MYELTPELYEKLAKRLESLPVDALKDVEIKAKGWDNIRIEIEKKLSELLDVTVDVGDDAMVMLNYQANWENASIPVITIGWVEVDETWTYQHFDSAEWDQWNG
jgi:hypothetical protein